MRRRVTVGLALLRATGYGALVLLIWNPSATRLTAGDAPPLVLLDASLSLAGYGGQWRAALDTARAVSRHAAGGGVIWRFGERVTAFDTLPPTDGVSRLAPALTDAAARGGPVVVVSDGAVSDLADVPPDLLAHARTIVLPRAPFFDAFVSAVEGPARVGVRDTIRLRVSYGTAGKRDGGRGRGKAMLSVTVEGRRLLTQPVVLPDSGVMSADLTLPPSLVPRPGWTALEVRLEGVKDSEPRDDARTLVLQVSPQPSVVVLASPPDWDTRFLARTLEDVARVPVRVLVAAGPGGGGAGGAGAAGGAGGGWRDASTLMPVAAPEVARAVRGAQLLVEAGDPATFVRFATPERGAVLLWPLTRRQEGDWYVQPPGASPLAGPLAGVAWDSLPPVTALAELAPDSATIVALTARLARRGAARPLVALSLAGEGGRGGTRRAVIAAGGLYRWAFRGGASGEAYRALVAGLTDWLLEQGAGSGERFLPMTDVVPNGTPLVWRWAAPGAPRNVVLSLTAARGARTDTLRFDAGGRAELRLPPAEYRYAAADGAERGLVVVDPYSDEWRPAPAPLASRNGAGNTRVAGVALRDGWWLFVLAIAAFTAEWAWRRRVGLP